MESHLRTLAHYSTETLKIKLKLINLFLLMLSLRKMSKLLTSSSLMKLTIQLYSRQWMDYRCKFKMREESLFNSSKIIRFHFTQTIWT